ncbi:MAG TPA: hypothetical protein DCL77_06930 [Prolixibacteraceae bacterium]|jgi:hypothetical protein|nr:hypothetical protein [Prolixibacteraceae bacterium]
MKKLVIFLAFVISANIAFAQINDKNASLSRKEKRKAKIEKQYQSVKDMIENKDFVLEANFLQDRYGRRYPVNNGINFVSVDSTEAVIQVGSNTRIGANGVGGVTAKGKITSWKLTENKRKNSFGLRINVMTPIGFYDVFFSILPSGQATAQLTGLRSGSLTFDGNIVPIENSTVYEGQSL